METSTSSAPNDDVRGLLLLWFISGTANRDCFNLEVVDGAMAVPNTDDVARECVGVGFNVAVTAPLRSFGVPPCIPLCAPPAAEVDSSPDLLPSAGKFRSRV